MSKTLKMRKLNHTMYEKNSTLCAVICINTDNIVSIF